MRWLGVSKGTESLSEEDEYLRLIKMWSNSFTMHKHGPVNEWASVQMQFGINCTNSLYTNERQAIIASYKRIHTHAWEMCKMVEELK